MDQIQPQPMPVSIPAGPSSLPGVDALFKQAWQIYKQRFWTLLGIIALPGVVAIIGGLFLGGTALIGSRAGLNPIAAGGSTLILFLVYVVLMVILGVWSEAALITNLASESGSMGIKQSFILAKGKIGALFLVNVLAGLAIAFGFVLLIIPGIILVVWYSQSCYVAVLEGLKGTDALKKSKTYAQGRFGAVFWRLAFIILISILLSLVIGMLVSPFNSASSNAVSQTLQNIVSFIWAPLAAAYGFVLYQALKKA